MEVTNKKTTNDLGDYPQLGGIQGDLRKEESGGRQQEKNITRNGGEKSEGRKIRSKKEKNKEVGKDRGGIIPITE